MVLNNQQLLEINTDVVVSSSTHAQLCKHCHYDCADGEFSDALMTFHL
jgi:hypothetical protein